MHARADEHAVPRVKEQCRVVRVDAVDREAEDARPLGRRGRPQHVEPRFVLERGGDPGVERRVVGPDLVAADALEVIDPGTGAEDPGVIL